MVSKTRDRLIEVARQLFARKGVENTTMLDIAAASDRGRRTLYTYFRNKREIHQAVIEREGEQTVARERAVQLSDLTAREKLRSILFARFETLRCEAAQRSADPRPLMSLLEGKRVGKIRRLAAIKEVEILRDVVAQGVASGEFRADVAERVVPLVVLMMLGVDATVSDRLLEVVGMSRDDTFSSAVDFILDAISVGSPDAGSPE